MITLVVRLQTLLASAIVWAESKALLGEICIPEF
jgi:hypothetical protein